MTEPLDPTPAIMTYDERAIWHAAIRLTGTMQPAQALAIVVGRCALIAEQRSWSIRLHIEPEGDACETGHFAEVNVVAGLVWADLTAWPARFGGAVPEQIDAELELAGWVQIEEGADADPINMVYGIEPDQMDGDQWLIASLPQRRLVTTLDDEGLLEWCDLVEHGIERVLAPRDRRWFITVEAVARAQEPWWLDPHRPLIDLAPEWVIDPGVFLPDGSWQRAVWNPEGEAGAICCDLGLHEYHEPPCPELPPAWSRARRGDD